MKIKKQVSYDLMQGIVKRRKLYLFVIGVSAVLTAAFYNSTQIAADASFFDVLLYMFRGMPEYRPELRKAFDVTDSYLIWNVILEFIIGSYPNKELKLTGKNHLIRVKKRSVWWGSKYVWNITSVIVFYLCIYLGMVIIVLWNHGMNFTINPEIFTCIFKTKLQMDLQGVIVLQAMILPVISSMAVSVLQMTAALIGNETSGYISAMAVSVLSAYYMVWFLPGNGSMVFRYLTVNENGIGLWLPLFAYFVIIVVCFFIGKRYFENMDIL